jgi:CheY-like chemotaxis protein
MAVSAIGPRTNMSIDEVVCCELIFSLLTAAGYQCRTAADGVDALDLLNSGEEFELLQTNLMMPSWMGSGCWNVRKEGRKERFAEMPVVVGGTLSSRPV